MRMRDKKQVRGESTFRADSVPPSYWSGVAQIQNKWFNQLWWPNSNLNALARLFYASPSSSNQLSCSPSPSSSFSSCTPLHALPLLRSSFVLTALGHFTNSLSPLYSELRNMGTQLDLDRTHADTLEPAKPFTQTRKSLTWIPS